jgi:hypothetical protein
MAKVLLLLAGLAALVLLDGALGQNASVHGSAKASVRVGAAFSKAAVRALLTIGGTADNRLLDAAIIDVSAAQSSHVELTVVWHIQLFQQIYAVHEIAGGHDEDQACIAAWLPKLRALSDEIPKSCPRLTSEEMAQMAKP